jgi:hypothetical protein
MRFNSRALVWLLGTIALFWALLQFQSQADPIVRALIWGYVAAVSVVMVILAVRSGGPVTHSAALPDRLRRWMYGESDEHRDDHA